MVSYSTAKFPLILKKLCDFNSDLKKTSTLVSLSMSDSEVTRLTAITTKLEADQSLTKDDFELLKKLLLWPPDKLFPVLDLVRMVADSSWCIHHLETDPSLFERILHIGKATPCNSTNMFLILKTVVNALRKDAKRAIIRGQHTEMFNVFEVASQMADKNVCNGLASAMLNYSLLEREVRGTNDLWATVILRTLQNCDDPESIFKFLVALGSLLVKDFDARRQALPKEQFNQVIKKFTNYTGSEKILQCVADLKMLLPEAIVL